MPKHPPFARIAITLPQADLAAADRMAAQLDRSRSWVIAESLRQYVAAVEARAVEVQAAGTPLGASRHEQLRRDLQLTAEQRLHEGDAVAAMGSAAADALEEPRRFASFDDFLAWRRAAAA